MGHEVKVSGSLHARVNVPGSKSITNRALICAALAKGQSVIRNASDSDDTALLANGLNQLGVLARKAGHDLIVAGTGGKLHAPKFPIPVGNAGTTLRFLIALSALAEGTVVLEGAPRMAERPMEELFAMLGALGAGAERKGSRFLVRGGGLNGGDVTTTGERSSQFLSSLLMVAPVAKSDVHIQVTGRLISAPYVEMTTAVMLQFGVEVHRPSLDRLTVRSGQTYRATEWSVEPDASAASYFFAAAAIAGGEVMVEGIARQSLQGDIAFLEILERMECDVRETSDGIAVCGSGRPKGIDVDLNAAPDLVPTLACVALFAEGKTTIRNVAHLRFKESDRLGALAAELGKLGAAVSVRDDGLEIDPRPLHGAELDSYEDHRLAMSFALIGLKVPGVKIENPQSVRKSFPGFWEEFEKLRHTHQ